MYTLSGMSTSPVRGSTSCLTAEPVTYTSLTYMRSIESLADEPSVVHACAMTATLPANRVLTCMDASLILRDGFPYAGVEILLQSYIWPFALREASFPGRTRNPHLHSG